MKYLLNTRELQCLAIACAAYRNRFGTDPAEDEDLFLFLGDNAANRLTWSAVSGRIPTFRTGGGRMYGVARQCWLTPKDRLAALGFPVDGETALAMGVPVLPVQDSLRAASVAGNSFHFMSAAVVQLVVLSSFKLA